MSYTIEHWEQLDCDLTLPPDLLDELEDAIEVKLRTGRIKIDLAAEEGYLSGKLEYGGDEFGSAVLIGARIDGIICYGSSSAMAYGEELLPIFRRSMGEMRAVMLWEGGDAKVVHVKDGVVREASLSIGSVGEALFNWVDQLALFKEHAFKDA